MTSWNRKALGYFIISAREWIGVDGAILKFLDVDYFQKATTESPCTRISKLLCRVILIEEER
jgi:hypothetical protein